MRLALAFLAFGKFIFYKLAGLLINVFKKFKIPLRLVWLGLVVKPYEYFWSTRKYRQQLIHNILPFKLMHQPWLPLLFVTIMAGLVIINNIRIRQINAGDFGQHSLLLTIVQEDLEAITEDAFISIPNISNMANVEDISLRPQTEKPINDNQEKEPNTTDEGSTLIKPYIVITERGVRQKAEDYIVESTDTLSSIAAKFGVSLATLLWENRLTERSVLRIGQKLTILPTSGVSHRIAKGDTLSRIASRYGVSVDKIKEFNNIEGSLVVGQVIVIPGGKPYIPPAPKPTTPKTLLANLAPSNLDAGTKLMWPAATRRISQYFSWRHGGIDLANSTGTPIYAAEEGVVQAAGWNRGGYGYYVTIDHGQGLRTLYGHASKLLVSAGERVARGQLIALIGSTGRSTGPHLHFEVIIQGRRANPLTYIR
ncbi:MAG: peptidoglycan DD-metalloendopeptidase family protein [Patescibacteria group bacterium]